jgi:hypothetical protein
VVNLGSVTINAPLIAGDLGKEFSGKVNVTGNVTFRRQRRGLWQAHLCRTGGLSVASGKTLTLKGGMDWATTSAISAGRARSRLPTGTDAGADGQPVIMQLSGNVTVNNSGTVTTAIGGGQGPAERQRGGE